MMGWTTDAPAWSSASTGRVITSTDGFTVSVTGSDVWGASGSGGATTAATMPDGFSFAVEDNDDRPVGRGGDVLAVAREVAAPTDAIGPSARAPVADPKKTVIAIASGALAATSREPILITVV